MEVNLLFTIEPFCENRATKIARQSFSRAQTTTTKLYAGGYSEKSEKFGEIMVVRGNMY